MRFAWIAAALVWAGAAAAQQETPAVGSDQAGQMKQRVDELKSGIVDCQKLEDQAQQQACLKDVTASKLKDLKELKDQHQEQIDEFKAKHQQEIERFKTNAKARLEQLKAHGDDMKAQRAACKAAEDQAACLKLVKDQDKAWWKERVQEVKRKGQELKDKLQQGQGGGTGK